MMLKRLPIPALRPFVKLLWASNQSTTPSSFVASRERVLPTGEIHIAFRLTDCPIRLFEDRNDLSGQTFGYSVLGGTRSSYYLRDISTPVCSVGVQLHPGATQALFGIPADEFSERHTQLEDLWGHFAREIREQLLESNRLDHRLNILESFLASQLPTVRGIHPAVAQALEQFQSLPDVREAVRQSGYSHRRFIVLFRQAVGLTPKLYCRLLRFKCSLNQLTTGKVQSWVDLALTAGYSDQSHFNREFREFTGVTPEEYCAISPLFPHHVPILSSTS
jgi:AraC-like DNA-binding protein